MTEITLDFRSSYRAITKADINLDLDRDAFGFDGNGIPTGEVTFIETDSNYVLPASNLYLGTDPFLLNHSARADQFDLISTAAPKPFLRFQFAVEGPPLWENYVQASYSGTDAYLKYSNDFEVFYAAVVLWQQYIRNNPFQASAATLSDTGGLLAEFSSNRPHLIQDFGFSQFISSIIYGSNFNDIFSAGLLACTLYGENGDDTLDGKTANDGIYGGKGADLLFGGAGDDAMGGDADDDTMQGGVGSDFMFGGAVLIR